MEQLEQIRSVSAAAFDDIPLCEMISPALTTDPSGQDPKTNITYAVSVYHAQIPRLIFVQGYILNL